MKRIIALIISLIVSGGAVASSQTSNGAAPAAAPIADRAQLETQFAVAETARAAAAINSKERADATNKAMQIASDIAWTSFDAGNFADASNWFARSADLKKDYNANRRAYWEQYLQTEAPQNELKLAERIKEWEAKLASAPESEKATLRGAIDALERNRHTLRYNACSMLESISRDSHDSEGALHYAEEELAIRRLEFTYLEQANAPEKDKQLGSVAIAKGLEAVGGAQARLARFAEAEKSYFAALAIREALPEQLAERKVESTLADLGFMYLHHVGDNRKARSYYEQALARMEASAGARRAALDVDPYPAELVAKMSADERTKHEANQKEMREMTVNLDIFSLALALDELGGAIQEAGDFKTAQSYYERALKTGETLGKEGNSSLTLLSRAQIRARVLSDLADLHAASGELELAAKELTEAVSIKRQIGADESTAHALVQLADMAFGRGDYQGAKTNVEQARQIFAGAHNLRSVVAATRFLAVIARDEDKLDEAAKLAEEALLLARKTSNNSLISSCARTSASIYLKQKKLDQAKTELDEARTADTQTGSMTDHISTVGHTGDVFDAEGNSDKAFEAYQEAVKLIEAVRSTAASEESFADVKNNYKPYERIVRTLIKLNRTTEAFDYLNRAKSKKLKDSMPLANVKSDDQGKQALLDHANDLNSRRDVANSQLQSEQSKVAAERDAKKIEALKQVVASSEGEYRRVFERIKTANPNWEKFMTVNPKSLKATQRGIPAGVMLVQYAPLGEQLYVFLVSKENLKIVIAPTKPEELWKKIKTVRKQITSGESGPPLNKNLMALYDQLIAPIEAELAPVKTIAFIPNQLLFYLPMQALAKKQANGGIRYLIEDKQVVYLTAADVMSVVQPQDDEKSIGGMIAFGNPTGANLPASETEVKAIAEVFPSTEVFSGSDVTKSTMKSGEHLNKRIVHFATHGVLDANRPAESYIQMAAGRPEQEHLTVGEVWDLPLKKVTLVTLSACESAVGDKEPDGGEITTLAEAFSSAGATSVLASQWSVGDESTKELMVEFYKELASGATKAAALQGAAVKLLKNPKFARPLYWAPFILMGDWR